MSLLDRFAARASRRSAARPALDRPVEVHPHLTRAATVPGSLRRVRPWLEDIGTELAGGGRQRAHPRTPGAQQAQIARRLEALERPARVIAFPEGRPRRDLAATRTCAAGSPWRPPPASSSASASARCWTCIDPFDTSRVAPATAAASRVARRPTGRPAVRCATANDLRNPRAMRRLRAAARRAPWCRSRTSTPHATRRRSSQVTWPPPNR